MSLMLTMNRYLLDKHPAWIFQWIARLLGILPIRIVFQKQQSVIHLTLLLAYQEVICNLPFWDFSGVYYHFNSSDEIFGFETFWLNCFSSQYFRSCIIIVNFKKIVVVSYEHTRPGRYLIIPVYFFHLLFSSQLLVKVLET